MSSTLCLFSEVRGVVLNQEKPVSGVVVERAFDWTWNGESGVDEAITDDKGEFRFPAIFRKSFWGAIIPHQPFIEQTLHVKYQEETYPTWILDKTDYRENSEIKGKPISLICRLENVPDQPNELFSSCEIR